MNFLFILIISYAQEQALDLNYVPPEKTVSFLTKTGFGLGSGIIPSNTFRSVSRNLILPLNSWKNP